jgi:hypothetical protein
MSEGNAKIKTTKKGQPMYSDEELTPCEVCGGLGLMANNLRLMPMFHHKIPSPHFEGYFTFSLAHQN